MIELEQNLGVSGEFQVIVRRADGSVRIDTGMQKNLILDNGLKYFLNMPMLDDKGLEETNIDYLLTNLAVGSGNQEPTKDDLSLQNYIAYTSNTRDTAYGKVEPSDTNHPNFVKVWKRTTFVFTGIKNQNISELGLITRYWHRYLDSPNQYDYRYLLATRALIKGSDGRPLTITVLEGELLEVIYQINMYVDIRRQTGEFKLTTYPTGQNPETGTGTESTFEYFLQPHDVGDGAPLSSRLYFHGYYNAITSYGVKETDDELTAEYDLTQEGYQFDHKNSDWSAFNKLIAGHKHSRSQTTYPHYNDYQTIEHFNKDLKTGKYTAVFRTGVYTHIYPNGIRGFKFGVGIVYSSSNHTIVDGIVIVKNKANGQGIKKTNRQVWELAVSFTVKRWGE